MVKIEEESAAANGGAETSRGNEERNGKMAATKAGTSPAATTATTTAKATVDGANGPKPTPPTLSPKMFISPVLLMGGKRLGIDYKDPAHVVKIRMCFVVAMTTLALAFAFCGCASSVRRKSWRKIRVR